MLLTLPREAAEATVAAVVSRPHDRRVLVLGAIPEDLPLWSDSAVDLSARTPEQVARAVGDHFRHNTPLVLMASNPATAVRLPPAVLAKFLAFRLAGGRGARRDGQTRRSPVPANAAPPLTARQPRTGKARA